MGISQISSPSFRVARAATFDPDSYESKVSEKQTVSAFPITADFSDSFYERGPFNCRRRVKQMTDKKESDILGPLLCFYTLLRTNILRYPLAQQWTLWENHCQIAMGRESRAKVAHFPVNRVHSYRPQREPLPIGGKGKESEGFFLESAIFLS